MFAVPFAIVILVLLSAAVSAVPKFGHCVMYGESNSAGGLNFAYNGPAKPIDPGSLFQRDLIKHCGQRYATINSTCCDPKQLESFRRKSSIAYNIIGGCPACWQNFLDFWCDFTCHPDQSKFVAVIDSRDRLVREVNYFVDRGFGRGFYESCRSVKFGPNNAFAMDLLGNGADNYLDMFRHMGSVSPFKIRFPNDETLATLMPAGISPLKKEALRCEDLKSGYQCSCVDCERVCLDPDSEDGRTDSIGGYLPKCSINGGRMSCYTALTLLLSGILTIILIFVALRQYFSSVRELDMTNIDLSNSFSYERMFPTLLSEPPDSDSIRESDSRGRTRTTTYGTAISSEGQWCLSSLEDPSVNVFFGDGEQFEFHPLQDKFQVVFCKLGYKCAKHPILTILMGTIFVLCASIGWILNFDVETDPVKLWVNPTSTAAVEKEYFDQHFGPFYRIQQLIFTASNGNAVVQESFVRQLFDIQRSIVELSATENGSIRFPDLCFQPLKDGNCMIQSVTGFWQDDIRMFDRAIKRNNGNFTQTLNECVLTPTNCLPKYLQPINVDLVFGGFSGSAENVLSAKAMIITILLNNHVDKDRLRDSKSWEIALIEYLLKAKADLLRQGIKMTFNTENSIELEINRESAADLPTITISYAVMFLYVALALGRYRSFKRLAVDSKFSVGMFGILIVLLSISSSIGLFSFAKFKVTMIIAEVIPFLVLAIGVDNIFLIVNQFERIGLDQLCENGMISPPEERVAFALGRIGPSLLLGALSETLAFSLGTLIGMPAVKTFSMIAALSIWIDFCLQITCFVALLALDARRSESDRVDCFPCVKVDSEPFIENEFSEGVLQRILRKYYVPFLLRPSVKVVVCFGFLAAFVVALINVEKVQLGLDQRIALPRDSYLVEYFDDMNQYLKVGPPVYFIARNISVEDASGQSQICSRFTGCAQNSMPNILERERKRSEKSFIAQPAANWFDDMMMWLNPLADSCCLFRKTENQLLGAFDGLKREICRPPKDDPIFDCETCIKPDDPQEYNNSVSGLPKDEKFREFLEYFLQSTPSMECSLGGSPYENAISLENKSVVASHFRTYHTVLKSQKDFIGAYESALRIAKDIEQQNPGISVFPYSIFYVFFHQYLGLFEILWMTVFLALAAVLICASLLFGSFRNALIMILTVFMIAVDLIGLVMFYWQIDLNALTLVNILICIGISVEFCTHLARAFTITSPRHQLFSIDEGRVVYHLNDSASYLGNNFDPTASNSHHLTGSRNRRVFVSLAEMGSSLLSGITLTKFCGITVLYFAKSKIFEIFYFRMYLGIIVLAALHSLVLLPVLLSLFGSHKIYHTSSLQSLAASISLIGNDALHFRPYSAISNYVDRYHFEEDEDETLDDDGENSVVSQ